MARSGSAGSQFGKRFRARLPVGLGVGVGQGVGSSHSGKNAVNVVKFIVWVHVF